MPLETFEYDFAEFLGSEEAIAEHLQLPTKMEMQTILLALLVFSRAVCQVFIAIPDLHNLLSTGH
jgi:hypothetical protein